ncbi:MAG: hypothetical protein LBR10_09960 [Prevotellaceae bacterium]|nr:hypothetical protein [Prevotellaceae bacterium]
MTHNVPALYKTEPPTGGEAYTGLLNEQYIYAYIGLYTMINNRFCIVKPIYVYIQNLTFDLTFGIY